MANSERLGQLVRAGMLYLTAQDAIALALENNIDIEVSRYNPFISAWNLERAQAGGALPGVPSSASQAGSVASGQGVAGSQAAAGVSVPGARSSGSSSNATVSQIGPVTQNLDPTLQENTTFSHISSPQPDEVQSGVFNLIENTQAYSGSYQQGYLAGGIAQVSYNDHYLSENASSDLLNPSVAPSSQRVGAAKSAARIRSGHQRPHHHGGPYESEHSGAQLQNPGDLRGEPGPECLLQPGCGLRRPAGEARCVGNRANICKRCEAADRNRIGGAQRLDRRRSRRQPPARRLWWIPTPRCSSRN